MKNTITSEPNGFMTNPLEKLIHISKNMSEFLKTRDIEEGVNSVLHETLVQSNAERIYILQYDHVKSEYSCTYEVVKENISREKDFFQGVKASFLPFWHELISQNLPITVPDIEKFKDEAPNEYSILKGQGIKSMMIVPILSRGEIFGCLGADIVEEEYDWTTIDCQAFALVANILGICITLYESECRAKEMYRELSNREVVFSNIFSSSPVGYELYDKDGFLIDNNSKDLEIFGIDDKFDTYGINLFENPQLSPSMIKLLRDGERVSFDISYDFSIVSSYFKTHNKGKKELYIQIIPIYGTPLKLTNYLMMAIDKTEVYQMTDILKDFERMFSEIADFAKVGYARWDLKTQKGFAVKQWYANWNESEDTPLTEIIGKYKKVHSDDRKLVLDYINGLETDNKKSFNNVVRVRNKNGSWKWVRSQIIASHLLDENNIEVIGLNYDVTQSKELEESLIKAKENAEMADKIKSTFLANMSHEIRTPLNSIVGFSNILVDSFDSSEKEKNSYRSIINTNSELLLELINDILDLSKIEAGTIEVQNGDFEVNAMMKDIEMVFASKMKENVKFITETQQGQCHIYGDKNRIIQIMSNLITNAIKFTEHGYIKIGYKIVHDKIVFSVEDTGIGIAPEELENVFKSFVKLNMFVQGSGLGLAVCKSLASKMDGQVGVKSKLGEGSTFTLEIPCNNEIEDGAFSNGETDRNRFGHSFPLILVVDNYENNYLYISSMMLKYRLCWAVNDQSAIDVYKNRHPNAVLIDVNPHDKNCIDLIRQIRDLGNNIPIIGMVSSISDLEKKEIIDAGCNDFLYKPIKSGELNKMVEHCFSDLI